MRKPNHFGWFTLLAVLVCIGTIGCNKNPEQTQAVQERPSTDPAQANLAPATEDAQNPRSAQRTPVQREQRAYATEPTNQAPADGPVDQDYDPGSEQSDAGEPIVAATEPPPPIPQYSQPECPGENYLWTPGTWNYASTGYYWVPGVWVIAPYIGALWTPPYWAYGGERYHWHHGYWGQHIGYYGGINYGFGYVGRGYEGGYWKRDHFAYNRTVNNVNVRVVQNVYNYRVTNITNVRVSYVGGRGGLNVRPTLAELAVLHEPRIAPLPAQVQHMRQAEGNRAQFVSNQKEHPETLVSAHPLATEYRAPAVSPSEVRGVRSIAPVAATTRVAPPPAPPQRMQAPPDARPGERPRPNERVMPSAPVMPGRQSMPNEHPQPQAVPAVRAPAVQPTRPELAPRPNAPVHAPPPESHPAPPTRMEQKPMPEPRAPERSIPQPEMREKTVPASRVEPRSETKPSPEPRVERPNAQPAPAPHPKAEEKKPGEHEH